MARQDGYVIYLALGFMVFIALLLNAANERVLYEVRLWGLADKSQNRFYLNDSLLQFALLDLQAQAPALALDEAGYIPTGITDNDNDKDTCLAKDSTYTALTKDNFFPSARLTTERYVGRYFIYDANRGSKPRVFWLYACLQEGGKVRLLRGKWEFVSATQDFNLITIISF